MDAQDLATWQRALLRYRHEKDEFFRLGAESPIPQGEKAVFRGLKYFEPDSGLRVEARLHRYTDPEAIMVSTSRGTRQIFNRVGYFELSIGGTVVLVNSYQAAEKDEPTLFIPFRDSTSGSESYGAARYLDMEVEHDDEYAVDFNYAYNPYCAYSEDYVCPLPPRENWLKVSIRAGEKKYHD